MSDLTYPGKLAIQQRVLPAYRAVFFDKLAGVCQGGLSVFAGRPGSNESIHTSDHLETAQLVQARNWNFARVNSPFYLCWQSGILQWLESWQPQALVVEANPRYLSTRRAVRWMHARGRPVLGWGLGASPLGGGLAPLRRWERLAFIKSLDGVIAYSQRGAQQYRTLGLPPQSVFWASNAAASRPAQPPPARPLQFKGKPCVLFVGRLQARKRIDNLLRACASLPVALQPRLVVVGDGPARDAFQALAQEIYPQAEFPGALHGQELKPFFAAADLFVLPGTGGLAVQEAMAHGLPVIVAEGDGTQDDLVRPKNGWLVPPGDLPALTTALQEALGDVILLRQMGAESYRLVDEEINLERMAAVFVAALRSVNFGQQW